MHIRAGDPGEGRKGLELDAGQHTGAAGVEQGEKRQNRRLGNPTTWGTRANRSDVQPHEVIERATDEGTIERTIADSGKNVSSGRSGGSL
jgi:hypothetical protein